jgi:Dolichyl-phosphate-mannose-protein mannosyltransferase
MTIITHTDRARTVFAAHTTRSSQSIRAAFGLLVLAIVGHACALRLIDVRPYAVFQHYQTWQWIAEGHSIAVWGVVAQTIFVAVVSWRCRSRLRETTSHVLSTPALLLVTALAGFSLAVPTLSVSRFLGEVILAGGLALVAALNLVLSVVMLPDSVLAGAVAWVDARVTLRPGVTEPQRWDQHLPIVVAIWVVFLAAVTSYSVLERVPHIDDSVSNFFQARYFAAGQLYLPAPPDAQSFQVDQTIIEPTKWYGYAFPAWPMVLAFGVRLGAPWLVNPILGGLLILLGHALVRRRCDRGTANVTVLVLAVSPWLIFMSAEFMAHPLTAVFVLWAALAFDHASARGPQWARWAVLAGLATGALMLTRAIDAALVIAALAFTTLVDRRFVRALPATVTAGVVAAAVGALILPYNQAVTGRATYPPHMAWSDRRWGPGVDRLGFGPDIGIREWPNLDPLPGHGAADVVLNLNKNAFMANVDLFGWASGSMLFIWLALGVGRWYRGDALMLALSASFALGYSAYWFSGGPDLGPRYWYPLLVPLAALTARGAQMVSAKLHGRGGLSHAGARIGALMLAASMSATFTMLPWRAVTKHYRYRGITGEIRALAASHRFHHALVFVRSERRDYQSAFNLNPKTLDDPETIYAIDAGPAHRAAVVARFSDRPVWVIGRRRASGANNAPFDIIAGPLPSGTIPP